MSFPDNRRRGPILLVGGGKMGGAMLAGWIKNGVDPSDIHVIEPDQKAGAALRDRHKIALHGDLPELDQAPTTQAQ